MTAGLISQHQQTPFSDPQNGQSADATVVLGNDNDTVTSYNAHDSDGTIHFQSSTAAARGVASTAGRKWLTTDTDAVYVYYDDGASWIEIDYLRNTGGAVTGAVSITTTTSPQFTVAYDGSNSVSVAVASDGAVTLNSTGAGAGFIFSDDLAVAATKKVRLDGSLTGNTYVYEYAADVIGTTIGGNLELRNTGIVTATDTGVVTVCSLTIPTGMSGLVYAECSVAEGTEGFIVACFAVNTAGTVAVSNVTNVYQAGVSAYVVTVNATGATVRIRANKVSGTGTFHWIGQLRMEVQ